MARFALIQLILFMTPFVLYFTWRAILVRLKRVSGGTFDERPIQALLIAGGVLVLAGFVWFASNSGVRGDTVYIPAHMENGVLVPGENIPREEAGEMARDPKGRTRPDDDE